jgi:23S rRNA pseudouridine2605 synthase
VVSRRAAEGLIVQGRVSVNGTPVTDLGSKADPNADVIAVDGQKVKTAVPLRYVLVNKPTGMVTTRSDPERRPTVLELVPPALGYLYPVGRLDYDSEGLLLLTNDGELAARLMHPRHEVPKIYRARTRGVPDGAAIERLTKGIPLDGHRTAPAGVRVLKRLDTPRGPDAVVEITLREGRNRQVRRMCEAVGHPVVSLDRVGFGPLRDPGLKVGHSRELTLGEIRALYASAGLDAPKPRPTDRRHGATGAPPPRTRPSSVPMIAPRPAKRRPPKPAGSGKAASGAPKPGFRGNSGQAKAATAPPQPRSHERSGSSPRPRRPSAGGRPRRG